MLSPPSVSVSLCPYYFQKRKRKKRQLHVQNVREEHSLFSLHAPNKLHQAYEIFLPPVQRLVSACIQLPLWL